jgi:hypothetical protein
MDEEKLEKAEEIEEKHCGSYYSIPGGATSFQQLDQIILAEAESDRVGGLARDFRGLVSNIMYSDDIVDKGTAVVELADEFQNRISGVGGVQPTNKSLLEKVADKIKGSEDDPPTSFMLIKGHGDQWLWFAKYSNKFRDRDNPPEIISEESHMGFAEKVNKGLAPYPELWLWHIPGTTWGKANWVGYDSSGYALAAGFVYPEYNEVAETLSSKKDIALSHGMPISTIVRDENDPSIIVGHETREISPLPLSVAANKMTGFVLFEENVMSDEVKQKGISPEDKSKLTDVLGISPDVIGAMEDANAAQAKEAEELGIESKEADDVVEDAPVTEETEVVETEVVEDVANGDTDVADDDIKEVMVEMIDAIAALNTKLDKSLEEFRGEIDSVKGAQEFAQATIEDTPMAARRSLLKSIVGDETIVVDGRTKLGKDKPNEEAADEGLFFFQKTDFLNGGQ